MRKPTLRVLASVAGALLVAGCRSPHADALRSPPERAAALVIDARLERVNRRGVADVIPNDRAVLLDAAGERHYVDARGATLVRDGLPPGRYALLVLRGRTGMDESEEDWSFVLPRDAERAVRVELEPGRPTYLGLVVRQVHGLEGVELERTADPERERAVWLGVLHDHPGTPWEAPIRERVEELETRLPQEVLQP